MVLIRIVFKTWITQEFLVFNMAEAEDLVHEYDSKDLLSVHYYPYHMNLNLNESV